MADASIERVYTQLCTHYLTGACRYTNCIKLHPHDVKQAKIEYNQKNTDLLCHDKKPHDVAKCRLIHIKSLNPILAPLVIDEDVKILNDRYLKLFSRLSQNLEHGSIDEPENKEIYRQLLAVKMSLQLSFSAEGTIDFILKQSRLYLNEFMDTKHTKAQEEEIKELALDLKEKIKEYIA